MFRRRRAGQDEPEDLGQELSEDDVADDLENGLEDDEAVLDSDEPEIGEPRAEGGPWDAGEPYTERERVDLGSLYVPVGPEHEVHLFVAEQHSAWVTARRGGVELQIQAFAASRKAALWEDLRAETAAEVHAAGGRTEEASGPFGPELIADVPVEPGQPQSGMRRIRFVGVDGPRWFLRGLFSGDPIFGGEHVEALEDVFRDVVVVRGEHPAPPRDLLELRLPPEARKALEEQAAAQQEEDSKFREAPNPFERGPEFTETR